MGTKRNYTTLDMQGNAIIGAATAAAGTNTQQVATTAFVTAALAGSAKTIPLIGTQASGFVTGLLGTDGALDGSNFKWESVYLPPGFKLYFEAYFSGSALTSQVTVAWYTLAGVAIPGATVSITGTAGGLIRSAAFTPPADQTMTQVHAKTSILGTGTVKNAQLIILPT